MKVAVIRKLVLHDGKANWGVAYEKYEHGKVPGRYFIHHSYLKNPGDQSKLEIGARVTFIPGEPRSNHELPIALDIEVVGSYAKDPTETKASSALAGGSAAQEAK